MLETGIEKNIEVTEKSTRRLRKQEQHNLTIYQEVIKKKHKTNTQNNIFKPFS